MKKRNIALIKSLGFVLWFARQDLLSPVSWGTTLSSFFTLFAVHLVTLLTLGVLFGYHAVSEHRIEQQPLARCMWVGNPAIESLRISNPQLAKLKAEIPAALINPSRFRGCYPFLEVSLDWPTGRNDEADRAQPTFRGRTLAAGDPILQDLSFDKKMTQGPVQEGVFVTQQMLKELKCAEQPPASLSLRAPDGLSVSLPVLRVITEDLPFGHMFLMTQATYQRLNQEHPNLPAATVYTGPIPASWPTPENLPKTVRDALATYEILPPDEDMWRGQRRWRLEAKTTVHPVSNWHSFVYQIGKLMEKASFPAAQEFARIEPDVQARADDVASTDGQESHDRAAIYVKEPRDFKKVAEVCDRLEIAYDKTIIAQFDSLDRSSLNAFRIIAGVLTLIAIMALSNLIVTQNLVVKQKLAAIGMLKAIGMSPTKLLSVYWCETAFLLTAALLLALFIGLPLGNWLAPIFLDAHDDVESQLAFQLPWTCITVVIVVAILVCSTATLAATRSARRLPPIATLSGNG